MVVQNNYMVPLVNGDIVEVVEVGAEEPARTKSLLHFRRVTVKDIATGAQHSTLLLEDTLYQSQPNLDKKQQCDLFVDFIMSEKKKGIEPKKNPQTFKKDMMDDPYLNALRCSWGYAVTCHKAQGGEWDEVYLDIRRNITLNPVKEAYQWVYTAITRAKKKLHVTKDFFIE